MVDAIVKRKREITITPVGFSAESVTGSCNIIKYNETAIAVELGGIQEGHSILENYNLNKRMLSNIKEKELNYVIICHLHYDHIGLCPYIFSKGKCNATVIVPKGSSSILREMWLDSAKIMEKDCEYLSKKTGKQYVPFYNTLDIDETFRHVVEFSSDEIIRLNDELSLRYTNAGHILLSQQLELFIKLNNRISKILISSDIGNLVTEEKRVFVENFKPVTNANVVLGESTYGLSSKRLSKNDFKKDLEKIKSVITQFCVDSNNRVLIPTFSLDKMAVVLWYLYDMFGHDESFKIPIVVDSPLAIRLLNCYSSILEGEKKELFDEMMAWENIKLIVDHLESVSCIADNQPKVILSSGGMLQSGRSVAWAQSLIPRSNDCLLFMGYCGVGTLGWKIKNSKEQKTITINNKPLRNRCQIVELRSFSSHMQNTELINYYKNINAECIYLLHGDLESRISLKESLEKEISNMSKTMKVKIINKSTIIHV
jgi:metallo-beta-lactamase family protein